MIPASQACEDTGLVQDAGSRRLDDDPGDLVGWDDVGLHPHPVYDDLREGAHISTGFKPHDLDLSFPNLPEELHGRLYVEVLPGRVLHGLLVDAGPLEALHQPPEGDVAEVGVLAQRA